jgi:hypothetical protein
MSDKRISVRIWQPVPPPSTGNSWRIDFNDGHSHIVVDGPTEDSAQARFCLDYGINRDLVIWLREAPPPPKRDERKPASAAIEGDAISYRRLCQRFHSDLVGTRKRFSADEVLQLSTSFGIRRGRRPMPRPRKAVTLMRQANDEKKRETLFIAKRRILRQLAKEGTITEAETQEQYVALDVILRLIKDPLTRPELKFLCAKELWPHEAMTLAEQARLDAADAAGGPAQISITVQGWAASKPPVASAPALPPPIDDDEIVV